jgi:hypothetical protein
MKKKKDKIATSPSRNAHQNGKGDSPRNISNQFKKNYEQINWKKKKGNK